MKVLVIGSGGREHALLWGLDHSKVVDALFCAPGNGGTSQIATNLPIDVVETDKLIQVVKEKGIDLTIVGPEVPLALGIVDEFRRAGLQIFGPTQKEAQLESSKSFTKDLLLKYDIPTAKAVTVDTIEDAKKALLDFSYPVVVKADGLCAGKGVIIAQNEEEAHDAIESILEGKRFGKEGQRILLEEFLQGYEVSLFCIASAGKLIPMQTAMDYKRIFEGDEGENTGGVGCISPNPKLSPAVEEKMLREVVPQIEKALMEEDLAFTGLLFIGFLVQDDVPYVLEFNTRFGDPETEALIPLLDSDLGEVFQKAMDQTLESKDLSYKEGVAMGVVLTAEGYPGTYRKGIELGDLKGFDEDIIIFHNGTAFHGEKWVSHGGRVLTFVTIQQTLEECREKLYKNLKNFRAEEIRYRKDIGL